MRHEDLAAVGAKRQPAHHGERAFRAQVARRLVTRRRWLGLSQQEVAARAGVSRNFVSAIERGAQSLDAWRLLRIGDVLGVTGAWILEGPDEQVTAPPPSRSVLVG
jgi:transcriptional regulator with XRE-family HTH domain